MEDILVIFDVEKGFAYQRSKICFLRNIFLFEYWISRTTFIEQYFLNHFQKE